MTELYENYECYVPPRWVRPSIERVLASLAPEHVAGLQSIVLTNSEVIGRGKTNRIRGKKYQRRKCRGFYHRTWHGEPAWIEIVVDSTIGIDLPRWMARDVVCDSILADVLYHEIGHHLDATIGSASRGGEASAEDWRRRLTRIHYRRRYWYLRPVLVALRFVLRIVGPMAKRHVIREASEPVR